ncbi:MAG: hypothetical protein ACI9DC_002880 [Gammaproteobacteria bacterium]|jgi:hypothetical protein
MASIQLRTILVVLALFLSACASTKPPPGDTDLRLQAANHYFGGRYEYLIVHSSGQLADTLSNRTSALTGASQVARDFATRLARAEKSTLRILISGADPKRTLKVIRDAFAFHASSNLPGLELLFLGEPRLEATVRKLVQTVGGKFRFAAFEG